MTYTESLSELETIALAEAEKKLSDTMRKIGLLEVDSIQSLHLNSTQTQDLEKQFALPHVQGLKVFLSSNDQIGVKLIITANERGSYHFCLYKGDGSSYEHNDRDGWILEDVEDAVKGYMEKK